MESYERLTAAQQDDRQYAWNESLANIRFEGLDVSPAFLAYEALYVNDDAYLSQIFKQLRTLTGYLEDLQQAENAKRALNHIQGELLVARMLELFTQPLTGNFDRQHLLDTNQYIFQDLPLFGYALEQLDDDKWKAMGNRLQHEHAPGMFRLEVHKGPDTVWHKHRTIGKPVIHSLSTYSYMDDCALKLLDRTLARIGLVQIQALALPEFVRELEDIYRHLDWIHPFIDGNSRTLRIFMALAARAAGFRICWSQTDPRTLCMARDVRLNETALQNLTPNLSERFVGEIRYNSEYLRTLGAQSLADLLQTLTTKV